MTTAYELIQMVMSANKDQVDRMIYEFDNMGFYREDKRVRKKYIISCINHSYNYLDCYEQIRMEQAIIKSMTL